MGQRNSKPNLVVCSVLTVVGSSGWALYIRLYRSAELCTRCRCHVCSAFLGTLSFAVVHFTCIHNKLHVMERSLCPRAMVGLVGVVSSSSPLAYYFSIYCVRRAQQKGLGTAFDQFVCFHGSARWNTKTISFDSEAVLWSMCLVSCMPCLSHLHVGRHEYLPSLYTDGTF